LPLPGEPPRPVRRGPGPRPGGRGAGALRADRRRGVPARGPAAGEPLVVPAGHRVRPPRRGAGRARRGDRPREEPARHHPGRSCAAVPAMTPARAQRWTALTLLTAVTALGCAGAELDQRTRQLRVTLKQARAAGAYQCAPKELAVAETHADFAERALEAGDYFGAKGHLAVADSSAQRAIANSAPDRCQGADADRDGVPDRVDRCPKDPEDKDGFEDVDGCPDPDNDMDGLQDTRDKCPNEPEDVDGFRDDDGCPDPDNDQDGVVDAQDKCPLEPEDKDGFQDDDGCPDPDNDKDGYLDGVDKCPNEPGPAGGDGCPNKFKFISVTAERIELRQTIFFRTNKAEIMSKSYPLLDEVALVLKSRPTMRVR